MPIANRKLKPGTVLVARYKKHDYKCTVVKGEDGNLIYRLHGGEDHMSPSSAGVGVKGRDKTCDGWEFWSVEGAKPVPPRAQRKQQESAKPKAKTKTSAKKADSKGKGKTKAKAETKPKPVKCGDCGQEFPNAREAANHMRDEHNSQEAAGRGS